MKFCSNCGNQLFNEPKFCSGCGSKMPEIIPQQTVSSHPVAETKIDTITHKILMPDGAIYEGELKDGLANGFGKFTYPEPDGDPKYSSLFEKGLIYEGDFLNGKKHGFGKLSNENYVYDGNWKFNEKSGLGKETEYKGSDTIIEYEGEFENDRKNGNGTFKEYGEGVLYPFEFEGKFCMDEFDFGLLKGSFLGTPPTYSIRYEGSFLPKTSNSARMLLLDKFPALNGELLFTWHNTGVTSKHIIKWGECESYDLMREREYLMRERELDDDVDED